MYRATHGQTHQSTNPPPNNEPPTATRCRREDDILADFEGDDGDRRNELVFIGVGLFEKKNQVCVGVGWVCGCGYIREWVRKIVVHGGLNPIHAPCTCTPQRVLHSRLDACLLTDEEMAVYREKAQLGEGSARALFDAFPNRIEIDMSPQGPQP